MLLSAYSPAKLFRPVAIDNGFTRLKEKARQWFAEFDLRVV
jgi:hypothetical protein